MDLKKKSRDSKDMVERKPVKDKTFPAIGRRKGQVNKGGYNAMFKEGDEFEVTDAAFSVRTMRAKNKKDQERMEKAEADRMAEITAIQQEKREKIRELRQAVASN